MNITYLSCKYEGSVRENELPLPQPEFDFQSSTAGNENGTIFEAKLTAKSKQTETGLIARAIIKDWSRDCFLLVPGAVYNGNRFPVIKVPYSPRVPVELCNAVDSPYITDVSRFEMDAMQSQIELLAGDMAAPCLALFNPSTETAEIFHFAPGNQYCENGLALFENLETGELQIDFCAPGVRSERYIHMSTGNKSPDRGVTLDTDESLSMAVRHESLACADLDTFYRAVFERRTKLLPKATEPVTTDLKVAFREIEAKYNRENWNEEVGLYLSSPGNDRNPYQSGWCGGLLATWPLLKDGNETSQERAIRMFKTITSDGINDAGLFYCKWHPEGGWNSDGWNWDEAPHYQNFALIRRQSDTLYYGLKILDWLETRDGRNVWAKEAAALERNAQALANIWNTHGQFGQFIDQTTGEITIGGSTCGALVPAALATASERFENTELLTIAEKALRDMDDKFLRKGVCTGGIGDAAQVPDSESTAALLESAMVLHHITENACWLEPAKRAAEQAASWVMPYDYDFPSKSEFGRLDMKSAGTVFANVQNKHSAPGICTHSGVSLRQLSEATGDPRYADLLDDIALALPQHVSTEERPIHSSAGEPLPAGWINERVNTSDWDHNLGGVFHGSCWCEISLMLTYAEYAS